MRIKTGVTAHHRHKKVLALTKGQRASRHSLYRRAHESMLHSLSYAYAHRRERKSDMRRLWITRINAAAQANGISYSRFINGLRRASIEIDRKMLADLAVRQPDAFTKLVETAQAA
ncbi:MAG: 50S ribosomal protein L20 [Dehalococcoidales bacterium]|nr:50S ribosomal protein L20 [Dehalococcoidales bacterium]MDD3264824.1 50S ribosomal protein L20 [Dehalococcoidales bacterium]MDD4322570.1 50S ribosomal protein L20 [Dehalococcoidales bacterium]MDD4794361.1 50S ribosomal protein L20 [Dehalococcoidales bacterium]MDD5122213.1 50S ribosomal protein L20 [Dehalococcoidales bacterium]